MVAFFNSLFYLLTTLSSGIAAQNSYKSKSLIVRFDGYYDETSRSEFIVQSLRTDHVINLEKRPNEFSDFDVIEILSCNQSSLTKSLLMHNRIYSLHDNARISVTLRMPSSLQQHSVKTSKYHFTKLLNAEKLWKLGYKGKEVKVAIFDTGLSKHHPHFKRIEERTDWTNEGTADDRHGHGTFVAGIIASASKKCPGLASEASVYIYKVFTKDQSSSTSWFLDAFNHAIFRQVNIINLSIGGPDFKDTPFIDKLWELSANNIIVISAIGNGGPSFGTLNNPADQMDVIGVGGIGLDSKIAHYSSRGMTTWELPGGYGRVKPDIVTFSSSLLASAVDGGCRILSGTSLASSVVTGAVAILLSSIKNREFWNPAAVRQIITGRGVRIEDCGIFEQGSGKLNLVASFVLFRKYEPKITLIPPYMDFTECPYMWPYCSQPLYYSEIPIIVNVTIVNGLDKTGKIVQIIWEPFLSENGHLLKISIDHSHFLWPWSGYLAIFIAVSSEGRTYNGISSGRIRIIVMSEAKGERKSSFAFFPIRARVIPTPPKTKRILWDQFRNIQYPLGYIPTDNLSGRSSSPLDSNGDHPHTNFRSLYEQMISSGYYIEVLGEPVTCINLSHYSIYLIVDPEDEFFPEESRAIYNAVANNELNVIVFADWFNENIIEKMKFMDTTTKQWSRPETGGSNLPALNELLGLWNFTLSFRVFEGTFSVGQNIIKYASGSSIIQAPRGSYLIFSNLTDQGAEILSGEKEVLLQEAAVFGIYRKRGYKKKVPGFIAIFGDSSCLGPFSRVEPGNCIFLLQSLADSIESGLHIHRSLASLVTAPADFFGERPGKSSATKRYIISNFPAHSKVVKGFHDRSTPILRDLPVCGGFFEAYSRPIFNITFSVISNITHHWTNSIYSRQYQEVSYADSIDGMETENLFVRKKFRSFKFYYFFNCFALLLVFSLCYRLLSPLLC